MFAIPNASPRLITAEEIEVYIRNGLANRRLQNKSTPYETEEDPEAAIKRDAATIAEQYNAKSRDAEFTEQLRLDMYRDVISIQFGFDPIPLVGDMYLGHTVTDVVYVKFGKVEIHGVKGKMKKRDREKLAQFHGTSYVLRDQAQRRGYLVTELVAVMQSLGSH